MSKDYAQIHQEEFHDHLAHAGWRHGAEYNAERKEHPWMMPWIQLSAEEQDNFIAEYEGMVSQREPADPKHAGPSDLIDAPKDEAPKAEAKAEAPPAPKADEPPPAA